MFVVGRVFGEVVAALRAEELVEDVYDGGGVVTAVFAEGAGWTAVGVAAVAVAGSAASAFGDRIEALDDDTGEAEAVGASGPTLATPVA